MIQSQATCCVTNLCKNNFQIYEHVEVWCHDWFLFEFWKKDDDVLSQCQFWFNFYLIFVLWVVNVHETNPTPKTSPWSCYLKERGSNELVLGSRNVLNSRISSSRGWLSWNGRNNKKGKERKCPRLVLKINFIV